MKTFEEVKNDLATNFSCGIAIINKDLEQDNLKSFEKKGKEMAIREFQKNLDNLDEITVIEIGAETNILIKLIGEAYKRHLDIYWQDFNKFMNDYVIGLTPDGKMKNGAFYGRSQCMTLGIGLEELMCFKGRDPLSDETTDMFRKIINTNFGTNIPMASVERQILQNYRGTNFNVSQDIKDKVLIDLKKMQRDAGILKNGQTYYPLATDNAYQEAVARTVGKTL